MFINSAWEKGKTISIITAEAILEQCFDALLKNIILKFQKLDIDDEAIKSAMDEIVKLNPKPGNSLIESSKSIQIYHTRFYPHRV